MVVWLLFRPLLVLVPFRQLALLAGLLVGAQLFGIDVVGMGLDYLAQLLGLDSLLWSEVVPW